MTPVTNIAQLNQLMNNTMIYAVVVSLAAVGVAYVLANLFPWEGGKDRSYIKRRIACIVTGLVFSFGFWLYNDLSVKGYIKNAGFQNMFEACNLKCFGIIIGTFIVVSLILMFAFRRSKFGSILGKEKK